MKSDYRIQALMLGVLIGLAHMALAEGAPSSGVRATHKLVIQVSSADEVTQKIALNNAVNMHKAPDQDNVSIEVVAYGPGLILLTKKSTLSQRVADLAVQGIRFSACGNTMHKLAKKSGDMPVLIEGIQMVPVGVLRIMELQEQGYAYIRP